MQTISAVSQLSVSHQSVGNGLWIVKMICGIVSFRCIFPTEQHLSVVFTARETFIYIILIISRGHFIVKVEVIFALYSKWISAELILHDIAQLYLCLGLAVGYIIGVSFSLTVNKKLITNLIVAVGKGGQLVVVTGFKFCHWLNRLVWVVHVHEFSCLFGYLVHIDKSLRYSVLGIC